MEASRLIKVLGLVVVFWLVHYFWCRGHLLFHLVLNIWCGCWSCFLTIFEQIIDILRLKELALEQVVGLAEDSRNFLRVIYFLRLR